MFSATDMTGISMKCWWTIPMPARMASPGEWKVTGAPFRRISPSSGRDRPYRTFISVVLPAPFSPRSAWTSRRRRSRSIESLATIPGKRLVIPRSSRTGLSGSAIAGILVLPPRPLQRTGRTIDGAGRARRPAPSIEDRLFPGGNLDLAARDQLRESVRALDVGRTNLLRQLRAQLAVPDSTVLDRVVLVVAGLEPVRVLRILGDRVVHGDVHLLRRAREDVRAEEGLVGVHADAEE